MLRFVSARWVGALVVLVVVGGVWFRLTSYGDLRLSITGLQLTYFADPVGGERHVVFAVMLFSLLVWLGLLVLMDAAGRQAKESAAA